MDATHFWFIEKNLLYIYFIISCGIQCLAEFPREKVTKFGSVKPNETKNNALPGNQATRRQRNRYKFSCGLHRVLNALCHLAQRNQIPLGLSLPQEFICDHAAASCCSLSPTSHLRVTCFQCRLKSQRSLGNMEGECQQDQRIPSVTTNKKLPAAA